MKKLLSLGLLSLSTVTLFACSQGNNSSPGTSSMSKTKTEQSSEKKVPSNYKTALKKAESYLQTFPMSKDHLYEQLTSEYDKFPAEAARYAVDNIKADWNKQAVKAAKNYRDSMNMSTEAIKKQLTSQFDKFTEDQAEYGVQHIDE